MVDRTAAQRVGRYRAGHRGRGVGRIELLAPGWAAQALKVAAANLREKGARLDAARPALAAVLTTMNAPRPRHMDPETLLACLAAPKPVPAWSAHIRALFDEVPIEAVHRLVLTGVVDFEDLNRAARVWGIADGPTRHWVAEMADLRLAGSAARHL